MKEETRAQRALRRARMAREGNRASPQPNDVADEMPQILSDGTLEMINGVYGSILERLRGCSAYAVAVKGFPRDSEWELHGYSVASYRLVRDLRFGGLAVPAPNGGTWVVFGSDGDPSQASPAKTVDRNLHQLVDELASLGDGVQGAVAWQVCGDGPCNLRTVNCSQYDAFELLAELLCYLVRAELT